MQIGTVSWRSFLCIALAPVALIAQTSAPSASEPEPKPAEVLVLPEFTVSTARDDGYTATESTSGTRIATKVINLPYSISVLTEEFIKEFQLFDLDEQARFISGMAAGDPAQGGGGGTRLRGFSVPYFRNGFRRTQAPDSNSIARVEVIKGPQSAIYGRVSPGGVVNYISKVPSLTTQAGLSYTLGSYDYQRIEGFTTGPLVQDKLYYRVDAAYYDFERAKDFWFNRTTNVSGSLVFKPTKNTSVTLEHEYTHREMQGEQVFMRWRHQVSGVAVTEGSTFYMPDEALGHRLTQYAVNSALQRVIRENNSSYLKVEHRISPDLSVRFNAGYSDRSFFRHGTSTPALWLVDGLTAAQTATLATLNGIWTDITKGIWSGGRAGAHQTIDYTESGFQFDVTKKWQTRIPQRSLLTFDWFDTEQDQKTWALSGTPLANALTSLGLTTAAQRNSWLYPDPLNPAVSGYLPLPEFDANTWAPTASTTFHDKRRYYGTLFNHTAELLDGRLALLGSIRQDWAEYNNSGTESGKASQTSYSVGANYHIVPTKLVAYANVATGFEPTTRRDPNTGEVLDNLESFGGEIGFKGALMGERFSYSGAVFQIDEKNETTDNPLNPGGADLSLPALIPGATTRAKGVNLDVSGQVTDDLTLLANIAWTDARIIEHASNPALVGTRPTGTQTVPPRTYALAARYSFRKGALNGLRAGVTYQYSQRYQRIAPVYNTAGVMTSSPYNIDERNEWGAMLSYNFPKVRKAKISLTLNVINLLDEEKMTVAAYYPNGREIRFTTNVQF